MLSFPFTYFVTDNFYCILILKVLYKNRITRFQFLWFDNFFTMEENAVIDICKADITVKVVTLL